MIELALASLVGVIATAALTGNPLNVQSVNSMVQIIGASFVTFLMTHRSYQLFFKVSTAPAATAPADLPTLQG